MRRLMSCAAGAYDADGLATLSGVAECVGVTSSMGRAPRPCLQDLPAAQSESRLTASLGIQDVRTRALRVQAISAMTLSGVQEGVQWLVDAVVSSQLGGGPPRAIHAQQGK